MDRLIVELVQLASLWTGYAIPESLPPLERPTPSAMPCSCLGFYAYGRKTVAYGAVAKATDRLLLRSDIDVDAPMGRSILFHELVHALQAARGPAATGSGEWQRRERQAYALQYRYLATLREDAPWMSTAMGKDD